MRHLFFSLSLYLLLTTPTFAFYDTVSINTLPMGEGTKFCFSQDTSPKISSVVPLKLDNLMYLAATPNYTDFFFLTPTATETEPSVQVWQPPTEPPIFSQWNKNGPVVNCLGPFDNAMLQSFKLYIGVSNSFSDLLQNQKYRQFFNGFVTLPQPPKNWTVMVYMVGSDLESRGRNGSKDLLEMLTGTTPTSADTTNLVLTTGGSTREGWKTVKRSLVQDGQHYVLEDLGAKSMADPQTLSDFVLWATNHFPAQHYALILWNHGAGPQGYGLDTSEAGQSQMMSLTQLHQAYQTIRTQWGNLFDIVIYDACLMSSIEVAEITSTIANVMAGSAELEPAHGLNYEHLLHTITANPPPDGISFGKVVKTGYLQQTQEKKTSKDSHITYSVLDLTQLSTFRETLSQFATELKQVFTDRGFLTYQMLSQGIIRAPGYPGKSAGRQLRSLDEQQYIRVDLYNVLQTVSPEFPSLKFYANELQTNLQQLVVDYEANDNVKLIHPEAGRISIDIGTGEYKKLYLPVLPAAYTQLSEALDDYNQRRKQDTYNPDGEFVCASGTVCAAAKWWELPANEVISIDGYYGSQTDSGMDVYLIKPLYRYHPLDQDLEIGVNGHEACQYQLCVNDTECGNLTVTDNQKLRLADVLYNDLPAILTLCPDENANWQACRILPQLAGIWGREEPLTAGDTLTPTVLHLQNNQLTPQPSPPLVVGESVPFLKLECDTEKAVITARYFGDNRQPQFEQLCDQGDCVCQENDIDESCRQTDFQFKAGVRLKVE